MHDATTGSPRGARTLHTSRFLRPYPISRSRKLNPPSTKWTLARHTTPSHREEGPPGRSLPTDRSTRTDV
eukprot:6529625-Pyramimonas_sp.AAC.1